MRRAHVGMQGRLPTMVGVLPRDGEARDVRWFKGPSRNTLHFLNAIDVGNKITMDLPVSDEERSPSHFKRWMFDMNSKNDTFGEEVIPRTNGVLARMDDRFCRCPTVSATWATTTRAAVRHGGRRQSRRARPTNCHKRFDVTNTASPRAVLRRHVQGLQEAASRRAGQHAPRAMAMSSASPATMPRWRPSCYIVDAQRMEEGAIAVVKLPFRLRGGTHVNWFSADDLAAQKAETA